MTAFIQRLRRVTWTYRQALTHMPSVAGAPVSDLFVWKRSPEWRTFFDLTNMPGLYDDGLDSKSGQKCCVRIFDSTGRQVAEHQYVPPLHGKKLLDISGLVSGTEDPIGTFGVFHSHTPESASRLGCHLAERGYVSYRFRDAPLRSYVHGNLDAVSLNAAGGIEFLGGAGFRMREYRLQCELAVPGFYEITIVNPTGRTQKIVCKVLLTSDGRQTGSETVCLPAGGCHIFNVKPVGQSSRVVIVSRLVMARPLIFHIENQRLDVLHG